MNPLIKSKQALSFDTDTSSQNYHAWTFLTRPGSLQQYAAAWLAIQGGFIETATDGVLRLTTPGHNVQLEYWYWPAEHGEGPKLFAEILDRAQQEKKGVVVTRADQTYHTDSGRGSVQICYPLFVGDTCLVAAYTIQPGGDDQLQRAMRQLQWGIAWLEKYFLQTTPRPEEVSNQSVKDRLILVFDLLNGALEKNHSRDSAAFLSTELATMLCCDRVTVGLLERNRMKVLALSHSAAPQQKSNIILSIISVLEEGADQQETILFPPGEKSPPYIVHMHAEHAGKYGCGSLLTIPFTVQPGSVYGAILFERSEKQPFSEQDVLLCEAVVTLIAPVLREKYTNELPLRRIVPRRIKQHLVTTWGPEHPGRKVAAITLLLGMLFLVFAKGDFLIPAQVTLSGEIQRAVVAPFSGYISDASQRAGDHVKKDELLASLDIRDLTLDQLQWTSRKKQAEIEYQKAVADNLTSNAKIIMEQKKQAEIQLSLLELQKKRTNITAPFDGLLVKGDLSQSIGSPVERGQILFEIVPDNTFRVLLDVDEQDIGFIAPGHDGTLVFNALPHKQFTFSVEKITPVSTTTNGHTTFRVEGKLHNISPRLRPGMQGYGKILVARKQLIWIWSRPILDRTRLWFWSLHW